jgi:hypothetical protein
MYLATDLKTLVAVRVRQVRALERKLRRIIPHLFPHLPGGGTEGSGFRITVGRGRAPAAVPESGRGCATTSGARLSGIW